MLFRSTTVLAARVLLRESAPAIVAAILTEVELAHLRAGISAQLQAALDAAREALPGADWAGGDGEFVLFRLLGVLPFPVAAAAPTHPLAAALARVFDLTRLHHQHLGRLATRWVRWASRSLHTLVAARTAAYTIRTREWRATRPQTTTHTGPQTAAHHSTASTTTDASSTCSDTTQCTTSSDASA